MMLIASNLWPVTTVILYSLAHGLNGHGDVACSRNYDTALDDVIAYPGDVAVANAPTPNRESPVRSDLGKHVDV